MPVIHLDWTHIISVCIGFVLGLVLKILLDYNLAIYLVKYFHKLPVRFIFRKAPIQLSGEWKQLWDFSASSNFIRDEDRFSLTELKQLGNYVYAEFYSDGELYYMFGEIRDNYVVGHWGDCRDAHGYFGSFELRIVSSKELNGRWLGHSKTTQEIFGDKWTWKKKE